MLKLGLNSAGTPVLSDVANSSQHIRLHLRVPGGHLGRDQPVERGGLGGLLSWANRQPAAPWRPSPPIPAAGCTGTAPCMISPIWTAPIGTASKFTIPATSAGRVYVGTRDGTVHGFGSPSTAPLTGAPANLGPAPVGGAPATATVTATATAAATVTGVSAASTSMPDPFRTGPVTVTSGGSTRPVTLPVTLAPGDELNVAVTMTPHLPGGQSGFLNIATNSANFPAVSVPLTGTGVQAGLFATASTLSYNTMAGLDPAQNVDITNWGAASETIQSVSPPAAPFHAAGLPAPGTVLKPGQPIVVTVSFAPAAAGSGSSSFVIHGSAGAVAVSLTGTAAAGVSQMTASPQPVSFGSVPLGQQGTATLDITNTGNLPATLRSASVLGAPFGTPAPVTAGLPVNPSYDMKIPLTFTPSSTGTVTTSYVLTWTDVKGTHTLSVPVSGTGVNAAAGHTAVSPPGGGWTLNGSARMSGTSLVLTQAAANTAGSAVYSVPEPSYGLTASFTAKLGGGTGGDGLTFSLLNAAAEGPTALGGNGANLGFGGLSGVAITLETDKNAGDPSDNFVGIANGATGGTWTTWPPLRTCPRCAPAAT